ncbi:MAG: diguanylate cyclase domain [Chloroflexota bacterium]|jgi:diguanylate cyclase (GGDEF)-like protein|nr:diguanylate cyclase domain [Chloroflexota bacterium]
MTAVSPADSSARLASTDSASRLARVKALPAAIRDSEYMTVGRSLRFRAVQRRRTLTAARAGFLVVAAAVALDATVLLGVSGVSVGPAIALDAVVLLAALAGWWQLPRRLLHQPEAAAFVVMLAITVSTVVSGAAVPALAAQTVGYLLLLPSLIALVLPWRTVVHLRWLLGFSVIASLYLVVGPGGRFSAAERGDLGVVLIVSIGASVLGHLLLQRGQIGGFAQMERIKSLRRRREADHRELERVHRELERVHRELERTARIDPLTGAGNRRRLHEDLLAVRSNIDRSGATYGLMEIDLDHFKGINDKLGHLAGDDVLRRVVEAVQAATRTNDAVYRYGGEEFVVILPMNNRDELFAAAERLRTAVLELGIEHPANPSIDVVSISIGATLIGDDKLELSDEQWFWVVDRAMYAAKAGGRNQVRLATGLAA